MTITLPSVARRKTRRVTVVIGAGKPRTLRPRGRKLTIDLSGRRAGTVKVRITVHAEGGTRLRTTRVYRTCAKRRP